MTDVSRWPFWAPTPDASIEHALDLAGVKPGDHLLDLGCGDGRVLQAAVRRGATATGYEADASRARIAEERLSSLNGAARVEVADFHAAKLQADVVFAFLSPATLHRLRGRIAALPAGTRVVTYGYGFTGWAVEKHSDGCFLYILPPRASKASYESGWDAAAVAVAGPPQRTVLVALPFGAEAGQLDLEVSSNLGEFAEVYPGAYACDADTGIPIDIKVTMGAEGSLQVGGVRVQGRELLVVAIGGGEQMRRRKVRHDDIDVFRRTLLDVRAGRLAAAALLPEPDPAAQG